MEIHTTRPGEEPGRKSERRQQLGRRGTELQSKMARGGQNRWK